MTLTRRTFLMAAALPLPAAILSREQQERFLLAAKVTRKKRISTGVTGSSRLTLTDGNLTHDAHLQTIDEQKARFESNRGTEINFRDSYKYNIAAYRIDKLLGLRFVPTSVQRKVGGESGAVTWWVDNVLMMEKERYQKKIEPPNLDVWNDQIFQVRVFNELVYNTDANLGNLLITTNWRLWAVDFSRAFRLYKRLRNSKNLTRIDKRFYNGLRRINEENLTSNLRDVLTGGEIRGVVARCDKILAFFDAEIAKKGQERVVCSLPGH